MPNRWIKESCRSSKNLAQVSDMAERLFWRLITTADDFGRFIADADVVKGVCFSKIERIRIADVSKCLQMLADANLLKLYTIDERLYGYFINWEKHQGPHRAIKSKYPEPVDSKRLQTDVSNCSQLQALSNIPVLVPKTDTDTDLNLNSLNSLKSEEEVNSEFETFWEAYPKRNGKRIGKERSLKLFSAMSPSDRADATKAAVHYGRSRQATDGFVKDPERFLRADYWREWIEPETPQAIALKPQRFSPTAAAMAKVRELEALQRG